MPISGGTVPESPLHACTSGQLVLVGQGLFTALHSQLFIHSSRTTARGGAGPVGGVAGAARAELALPQVEYLQPVCHPNPTRSRRRHQGGRTVLRDESSEHRVSPSGGGGDYSEYSGAQGVQELNTVGSTPLSSAGRETRTRTRPLLGPQTRAGWSPRDRPARRGGGYTDIKRGGDHTGHRAVPCVFRGRQRPRLEYSGMRLNARLLSSECRNARAVSVWDCGMGTRMPAWLRAPRVCPRGRGRGGGCP